MKRLLLLGGGHAHVHVLHGMARERFAAAEVTLVTPFSRQMYSGMVPGVVAGHYRADEAAIQLAPLAAAAGATLVESAAISLEAKARRVHLANGQVLAYDVLSIDTGAVMDRGRLPGARLNAIFVRPIEHFLGDIEDLLDIAATRPLDVVVVGGGAAAVELALALQHRLAALVGPRGRRAPAEGATPPAGTTEPSRVALVAGGERVLPGYPEAVARAAEAALQRARITLFREPCAEVRADSVVLASGARLACDAPVLATGPEAPPWLTGSGLALDGQGFIVVGPTLQSGSHPEVFAVGDIATRIDAPHPKSGVYAVRAGPPLLANLRALCSSAPPGAPGVSGSAAAAGPALRRYTPQARSLNLLSCGRRFAIASRGGWWTEGAWVWWWKNHLDRKFVRRYSAPLASNSSSAPASSTAPAPSAPAAAAATPTPPEGRGSLTPS